MCFYSSPYSQLMTRVPAMKLSDQNVLYRHLCREVDEVGGGCMDLT